MPSLLVELRVRELKKNLAFSQLPHSTIPNKFNLYFILSVRLCHYYNFKIHHNCFIFHDSQKKLAKKSLKFYFQEHKPQKIISDFIRIYIEKNPQLLYIDLP